MSVENRLFGGENIRNEILNLLRSNKILFDHLLHQETAPHRVAEEVGVEVGKGIKCLIMRGKKSQKNYLICVLGHQKVDMKALSNLVEENCEFEKIEIIKERFGLEIGGIPPFGGLLGIEAYFDANIQGCKEVIFSCGLANESVQMKLEDLTSLIHSRFANFAKS